MYRDWPAMHQKWLRGNLFSKNLDGKPARIMQFISPPVSQNIA